MNTTPPYAPPSPPRAPWRFERRESGKLLAGVTTGMAEAFHIDVLVIRVLWVVAALATAGVAILAYAICWIAFPSDENPAPLREIRDRNFNAAAIAGLAALALGFVIISSHVLSVRPFRHGGLGVAFLLIGGGLAVMFLRHPDRDEATDPAPSPPEHTPISGAQTFAAADAPTIPAPSHPPETAPESSEAAATSSETATTDDAPTSTAWSQHSPWPAPPPVPPSPGWARSHWPRPPRRRRPRSFLTPITLSVLLIGAGAAALLDSIDAVHLTLAAVLASALIVVGAALVLSTWFGRARGLIPIGVLILLATIPASVIDVPISGGIGEREYHPITRTDLRREYKLGIGHLRIDLQDVPLSGEVTTIRGSLGIGELDVDVPANVRVDVRAHTGAGETELFGYVDDGWTKDVHRIAGVRQRGVLRLVLRVGAGSIKVHRYAPGGALLPS
jgi:phage shock protein PspC (stress-responsive transcriptional regulator)